MNNIEFEDVKPLIKLAIDEDIKSGDITSEAIFQQNEKSNSYIVSKDSGVLCGSFLADYIYSLIDENVAVDMVFQDGDSINPDDIVLKLSGKTKSILEGERILLNFMQRMSGIATKTHFIVELLKHTSIKILDTRKTLPGFRLLDKYAVSCGGGTNHRMGLFDLVMIKDNHIKAAGSIARAVSSVKMKWGKKYKIEVETTNLEEVEEAVIADVDIIMLDNMDYDSVRKSLEIINGKSLVELSGNMDEDKILNYMDLNVDFISVGALTHTVKAFDLSMKFE
jgi:nicotinate-nucleotide pyrophosphorylase (carboxylating)